MLNEVKGLNPYDYADRIPSILIDPFGTKPASPKPLKHVRDGDDNGIDDNPYEVEYAEIAKQPGFEKLPESVKARIYALTHSEGGDAPPISPFIEVLTYPEERRVEDLKLSDTAEKFIHDIERKLGFDPKIKTF